MSSILARCRHSATARSPGPPMAHWLFATSRGDDPAFQDQSGMEISGRQQGGAAHFPPRFSKLYQPFPLPLPALDFVLGSQRVGQRLSDQQLIFPLFSHSIPLCAATLALDPLEDEFEIAGPAGA